VIPENYKIKPEIFAQAVINYKHDEGEDIELNLATDRELQAKLAIMQNSNHSIYEYSVQVAELILTSSGKIRKIRKGMEEEPSNDTQYDPPPGPPPQG
jgi:hypothetical protein